jgi:transcriptional regulator with XRE-family HTH domain
MPDHLAENLRRLTAAAGLSIHQVARKTGLDRRTVRSISSGDVRPHAQTLHRLADGLGVSVDELFLDPTQLLYRHFDRRTNPLVGEVLQDHPELFAGWSEADFDELHSRVGIGGPLTREGTLVAARAMNRKRQLHEKLDLLLESSQAELIGGIVDLLYGQIQPDIGPTPCCSG